MDEIVKAIFSTAIATLLIVAGLGFLAIADLVVGLAKGDRYHLEGDRHQVSGAFASFNVVKTCLV